MALAQGSSAGPAVSPQLFGFSLAPLVYAVLGAGLAYIKEEDTMWRAFTTGLMAPALIIGLGGTAPSDRGSPVVPVVVAIPLYAAQLQPDPGPPSPLEREVVIRSPVPLENATVLVFWADGTVEPLRRNTSASDDVWLLHHHMGQSPVGLALNGAAHVVAGEVEVTVKTPQIPIPDGEGPLYLQLNLRQTFLGGLLDGLGFDRYANGMIDASLEAVDGPFVVF